MQQLNQAQKSLSEVTLGVMAINAKVSDLLSPSTTVASYTEDMNKIAELMQKVVQSLEQASEQMIEAAPFMISKLSLEGRFE